MNSVRATRWARIRTCFRIGSPQIRSNNLPSWFSIRPESLDHLYTVPRGTLVTVGAITPLALPGSLSNQHCPARSPAATIPSLGRIRGSLIPRGGGAMEKRRLGRGLDALIGNSDTAVEVVSSA